VLNDIILQVCVEGRWRWHLEPDRDYTVSGVYHMLTLMELVVREDAKDIIWNKSVLLKISIFPGNIYIYIYIYICLTIIT